MSFELRFLRKPSTTTDPDRLQYRLYEWSHWRDVPVVIEPALAAGEQPKHSERSTSESRVTPPAAKAETACRAALVELVRVYAWKDSLVPTHMDYTNDEIDSWRATAAEFDRCLPLAWAAARAAIAREAS